MRFLFALKAGKHNFYVKIISTPQQNKLNKLEFGHISTKYTLKYSKWNSNGFYKSFLLIFFFDLKIPLPNFAVNKNISFKNHSISYEMPHS